MVFLCPGVSQIKDLALFCHFKGNDKIQKEDDISGRFLAEASNAGGRENGGF